MPLAVRSSMSHSSHGTAGHGPFFCRFSAICAKTIGLERTRSPAHADARRAAILSGGKNVRVDLGRIAWVATVLACLIAVLILLLQGYYGYASVTFAVAVSAGINLT